MAGRFPHETSEPDLFVLARSRRQGRRPRTIRRDDGGLQPQFRREVPARRLRLHHHGVHHSENGETGVPDECRQKPGSEQCSPAGHLHDAVLAAQLGGKNERKSVRETDVARSNHDDPAGNRHSADGAQYSGDGPQMVRARTCATLTVQRMMNGKIELINLHMGESAEVFMQNFECQPCAALPVGRRSDQEQTFGRKRRSGTHDLPIPVRLPRHDRMWRIMAL